jgi:transposase
MGRIAHVGMDVDKAKIAVAMVKDYESEPRLQRIIRNRPGAVKALVDELSAGCDQVTMCYEAGACGFELYRRITDLGALCTVIVPASLPKKANDRIKTDRRDAVKLPMGLCSGELSPGSTSVASHVHPLGIVER